MIDYISPEVSIIYNNKTDNYQINANQPIKKGTIILKELPKYNLFNQKQIDRTIEMLYLMLKNESDINIKKLYPRKEITLLNNTSPYLINLIKYINKYPIDKIKKYLLGIDINKLYQYYYKYLFNAFDMHSTPVLLFKGAMMNHNCNPNVRFYEKNYIMYFETLKDINKNEELTYSYLRNSNVLSKIDRMNYLINHYNFKCLCELCQ
jgi:hypothetical protein